MRHYILLLFVLLTFSPSARAILTVDGDGRILVPPAQRYSGEGVKFIGEWNGFTGTAIDSHHFLTAAHVGGKIADVFTLGGKNYTAEAQDVIAGTDLAVWRVKERLPYWAELYDKHDEVGREIVLYGRGCQRGAPFLISGVMQGWLWGKTDGLLSWGRNRVEATGAMPGNNDTLIFAFDRSGANDEGTVGQGDSGGGVFMQDGNTWKLAGIIYASGGQYSLSKTGKPSFMAALYDARGLYRNTGTGWELYDPSLPHAIPTMAFASRVSSNVVAIRALLGDEAKPKKTGQFPLRIVLLGIAGVLTLIAFTSVWMARRQTAPNTFE